jgi:drug/metabolite transporter (DMT)-like permease
MLDYLASLGSVTCFGTVNALSKKAIGEIGRHKAIVYSYFTMVILFVIGSFFVMPAFSFPQELILDYVLIVSMGALGVIAAFKALDYGQSSIISPINKIYVLLVLVMSVFFLGESLSTGQIGGSVMIVASAIILGAGDGGKLKPEKWMLFAGISVVCRAYYYTFIKTFVEALGPYAATVVLELGIVLFVVLFHSIRGRDLSPPPLKKAFFPAASGTMIFFGSLLYSVSVGAIGAALTAAISAGAPIINAFASYFLLKEKLGFQKYLAIVLLAIGLVAIFVL